MVRVQDVASQPQRDERQRVGRLLRLEHRTPVGTIALDRVDHHG